MPQGDGPRDRRSIGELFVALAEDGRRLIQAKIDYYRQIGRRFARALRVALVLAGLGLFILLGSVSALMVGIGMLFALLVGPVAGMLLAASLGLVLGGLLLLLAARHLARPMGQARPADASESDE